MKKLIILFLILFNTNLYSEVVKNIDISGNKRISAETIKVYGSISLNQDYSQNDINIILKNLYETNFFSDVQLSIENQTLKIIVEEYPVINVIEIQGEKANKIIEVIKKRLSLKEKGSFIKNNLKKDIDLLKKVYASLGYNFATVETNVETFTENRINLTFIVTKGDETKIASINFIGDKKIKDRRLRDIIVSEEDKFWKFLSRNTNLSKANIDLDKRLLSNYYKSIGYYDVQIVSSNAEISSAKQTILTYNINAGNRYKINKISANINEVLDKSIFSPLNEIFNKNVGKYYSPFLVKKMLENLDLLIDENDLQFIEHSVSEIIDDESIEIKINIYEGSREVVERINIKGNTVTNESVIRSELLLDEGDPFNILKLDKSLANLKSRNIFGEVKKDIRAGSSKDLKEIDITVQEKPTGEISAGAGVGTSGGSFAFDISENNWLGRGIKLSTSLDIGAESLKGSLNISNPNYNFSGNEVFTYVSSSTDDKKDSGYENNSLSLGLGTRFEQYKDIYLSPALGFSREDLKVSSTASKTLKDQAGVFNELAFDYGITSDKRNRTFMPTDGYISSFNQTLPIYSDAAAIKNQYSFSAYESLTPNLTGAVKFYMGAINGLDKDVRISKRMQLSQSRLRGFKAGKVGPKDGGDYVGGNYAASLNFEGALPNLLPESTKTEVSVFLDMGSIWGVDYSSTVDDSSELRSSVGINTSWSSPVGPLSLIFSQNITKATTDETESFNFKLGTSF